MVGKNYKFAYLSLYKSTYNTERCQSGRMERTANALTPKGVPGFESLPLRH